MSAAGEQRAPQPVTTRWRHPYLVAILTAIGLVAVPFVLP